MSLKIPRLTISNHKSFIRVVEIPLSQKNSLGWNQDFVFLESTKDKARYITLKLQELNAKWKALQEENEIIQRALSDDLCNQVYNVILGTIISSICRDVQCSFIYPNPLTID